MECEGRAARTYRIGGASCGNWMREIIVSAPRHALLVHRARGTRSMRGMGQPVWDNIKIQEILWDS